MKGVSHRGNRVAANFRGNKGHDDCVKKKRDENAEWKSCTQRAHFSQLIELSKRLSFRSLIPFDARFTNHLAILQLHSKWRSLIAALRSNAPMPRRKKILGVKSRRLVCLNSVIINK